jgi:hypothetical protein
MACLADAVTVALAGLGAVAVGGAVFLILELSDPYTGTARRTPGARGPAATLQRFLTGDAKPGHFVKFVKPCRPIAKIHAPISSASVSAITSVAL